MAAVQELGSDWCHARRIPHDGTTRVACVGDSLTRGDGRHEPGLGTHSPLKAEILGRGSYPARLGQQLGPRFEVGNFDRSGITAMTGDSAGDGVGWGQRERRLGCVIRP